MGSQRYRCCPPQTLSVDATCATDHCKNKHHHREKKELKYLPLFISPKLRSSSDFAYASSILIPLGWAVRYKELPLALKMPFFHLSFNKNRKVFFLSLVRSAEQTARVASVCAASNRSASQHHVSLDLSLEQHRPSGARPGGQGLHSLLSYARAKESNFSPSEAAGNSGEWWGGGMTPGHHSLVRVHQHPMLIESLRGAKPCAKFCLLSLCTNSKMEETVNICWAFLIHWALNQMC